MTEYHVPDTPDGEPFEFAGLRIVANADVPAGMIEIHDEDGSLERRYDWRRDFERWQRERS